MDFDMIYGNQKRLEARKVNFLTRALVLRKSVREALNGKKTVLEILEFYFTVYSTNIAAW